MRASASGSFGAFLIIAPLVAIPILATIGVPQFAPALSRARDSLDVGEAAAVRLGVAQTGTPAGSNSADDLFQPVRSLGEPAPAFETASTTDRPSSLAATPAPLYDSRGPQHPVAPAVRSSLPAEAVAGWALDNELLPPAETDAAPSWNSAVDRFGQPPSTPPTPEVTVPQPRPAATKPLRVWAAEQTPTSGPAPAVPTRKVNLREIPDERSLAAAASSAGKPVRGTLVADRNRGLPTATLNPASASSAATLRNDTEATPRPTLSPATRSLFPQDSLNPAKPPPVRTLPEQSPPSTRTQSAGPYTSPRDSVALADQDPATPLGDTATTTAPATSDKMTWSRTYQRLRELGVRNPRLEPLENDAGYAFSCTLFPAGQSRVAQRFEAEDPDPLTAALQVLQQLEEWTAQR